MLLAFCLQQVVALGPWIALAVVASAALIIPRSIASAFQTSAVRWSLEYEVYLFEHIGMFSPIVPMIVTIPNGFCVFRSVVDCASCASQVQLDVETGFFTRHPTPRVLRKDFHQTPPHLPRIIRIMLNPSHPNTSGTTCRWTLTQDLDKAALARQYHRNSRGNRDHAVLWLPKPYRHRGNWHKIGLATTEARCHISVQGRQNALDCANELSSRLGMTLSSGCHLNNWTSNRANVA